jgi:hypothetical protein
MILGFIVASIADTVRDVSDKIIAILVSAYTGVYKCHKTIVFHFNTRYCHGLQIKQ